MSASLADARVRRAARAVTPTADAARVTALVQREGEALLAYFTRRVLPREDAADLLSETFTVLWRRARDLPDGDEASGCGSTASPGKFSRLTDEDKDAGAR